MSVSQVKKQFAEFATYLGRDTTGQERLKKLKDAVNELRTSLASAEAHAADAAKTAENMSQRARKAEHELATATSEIQRLQQLNQSLTLRLQAATTDAAAVESVNEDVPATTVSELEIKQVVKRLRSRLKFCPPPLCLYAIQKKREDDAESVRVWDRDAIATGWSHEAIWALGATLAVLSHLEGVVAIKSKNMMRHREVTDPNDDASVWRHFIQWWSKNNLAFPESSKRFGFVRATNLTGPLICDPDAVSESLQPWRK